MRAALLCTLTQPVALLSGLGSGAYRTHQAVQQAQFELGLGAGPSSRLRSFKSKSCAVSTPSMRSTCTQGRCADLVNQAGRAGVRLDCILPSSAPCLPA